MPKDQFDPITQDWLDSPEAIRELQDLVRTLVRQVDALTNTLEAMSEAHKQNAVPVPMVQCPGCGAHVRISPCWNCKGLVPDVPIGSLVCGAEDKQVGEITKGRVRVFCRLPAGHAQRHEFVKGGG